ncbi:MAG TPA: SDR family oxidoreductase [Pseudonocardia sp.]|nr:SDR family oxidoreductase [Pseudonocardia sp.]
MKGATAVVVGGTHGMGLAMVRALVDRGASVVATGRGTPDGAGAAHGEAVRFVRSDITSSGDLAELARLVGSTFGTVDALFVNAGFARLEPIAEVTAESYDRTFAVNTRGAFFTVQRLAPLVRDGGAIVMTTSIAGETGTAGMSVYSGAKAAVRAFVRVFAAELLDRGIRVNAVSPGFVRTPTMGVAGASDAERAEFEAEGAAATPLGRIGSPEEVARAALFLAFDATFTTGAELPVDGGLAQQLEAS